MKNYIEAIVKLKGTATLPKYVELRMHITGLIYTVNVLEEDWDRFVHDPAVYSVTKGKKMPMID
jgi:hypothetical protein